MGRVVVLAILLGSVAAAQADVASDQGAAILVFPKIVVDTSNVRGRGRLDTLIRISNTENKAVRIQCFWVNANGHCSNSPGTICDPYLLPRDTRCGATSLCQPGWQETDFIVNITARQPVAWLASHGGFLCEDEVNPTPPCFPIPGSPLAGANNNAESRVPAVLEDPFVGELKCVAVDQNDQPVERNVLIGEAEIVRLDTATLDIEGYNAIGIPAIEGTNNGDSALVLGGQFAEYSACPNVLILDHFFDGASDPISNTTITTQLTLVPCSEDFHTQSQLPTPVQFLVYNEFEQRFSTSKAVTCFREFRISNIDTASADRSIFSAAVEGTLTGQTRIQGVGDPKDRAHGHTLLGVAEEFRQGQGSAAFNLHFHGSRPQSDFIYLP
jgi:hypothetical protein